MKKVHLKIKGSKVTADFSGFIGNACEELEKKIQPGEVEVEEKSLKPEYHINSGHSETETENNLC